MKVCIIGAGPAGLTAAYLLAKAGIEVEVFEAGAEVGGMARSFQLWGQTVDLGPHRFFSSDARVNRLWLEIVERDYAMVQRLTRVFYAGRLFRYPLEPADALIKLGPAKAAACIASYLREKIRSGTPDEDSFESWVVRRFGRHLFEIFFKSYSEKLWGVSCRELDADFAAQRIKKLSLGEVIKNALGLGKNKHRTLVDTFAYPLGGTGMVYQRMADYVNALGAVHLKRPVKRVLHEGRQVKGLELMDGRTVTCDHVISTMPLTLLVKGLEGTPAEVHRAAGSLKFRNTVLVYLHVGGKDLFPDQWIYVQSPDLDVGRITNFRNWVPQLYGAADTSILSMEYWSYDEDEDWRKTDQQFIDRARREIQTTGLLGSAAVLDGAVVRIHRCYPVYARGYQDHLAVVQSYVNQFAGLTPIGRYGAFKYNNQDHSILMGILAADQLLTREDQDLWSVNTDYESYQEAAVIGATGLEPQAR